MGQHDGFLIEGEETSDVTWSTSEQVHRTISAVAAQLDSLQSRFQPDKLAHVFSDRCFSPLLSVQQTAAAAMHVARSAAKSGQSINGAAWNAGISRPAILEEESSTPVCSRPERKTETQVR